MTFRPILGDVGAGIAWDINIGTDKNRLALAMLYDLMGSRNGQSLFVPQPVQTPPAYESITQTSTPQPYPLGTPTAAPGSQPLRTIRPDVTSNPDKEKTLLENANNTILQPAINFFDQKIAQPALDLITEAKSNAVSLGNQAGQIFQDIQSYVKDTFVQPVVNTISDIDAAIRNEISNRFDNLGNAASTLPASIVSSPIISNIMQSGSEFMSSVSQETATGIVNRVQTKVAEAITTAQQNGAELVSNLQDLWSSTVSTVGTTGNTAISTAQNAVSAAFSTASNSVSAAVSTVKSVASMAVSTVKSAVSTAVNTVRSAVSTVTSTVSKAVSIAVNTVRSVANTVVNTAKSVVSTASKAVSSAATTVSKTVSNVVSSVTSWFHW